MTLLRFLVWVWAWMLSPGTLLPHTGFTGIVCTAIVFAALPGKGNLKTFFARSLLVTLCFVLDDAQVELCARTDAVLPAGSR